MITPTFTTMNANSVPMLTMNSSVPTGVRAATSATSVPMATVIRSGVPVRWFTFPKAGGSSQSRDIANSTRVAPMSRVITTVVRPATAPAAISVARLFDRAQAADPAMNTASPGR